MNQKEKDLLERLIGALTKYQSSRCIKNGGNPDKDTMVVPTEAGAVFMSKIHAPNCEGDH